MAALLKCILLSVNEITMKKILLQLFILTSLTATLAAQGKLEGKIFDNADADKLGLAGANVYWSGTVTGTSTNPAGYFSIKRVKGADRLVISFIGYRTDTVSVGLKETYFQHGLSMNNQMSEITVVGKAQGSHLDKLNPILTTKITGAELKKAACCNLSESFETNASVDVNYPDAASGAKQIQLLGLTGNYTQILAENIPTLGGIATPYGLSYIPGPWMESIQVSKGTSSVRNGYESIAGQLNVEFKKPAESEKFYLNGFVSDANRQEINAHGSTILNDKWSTMLLAHGELQNTAKDHNDDGFRDEPAVKQIHLFNRWDRMTDLGDFRAGIKYLAEERTGGQFGFNPSNTDSWLSNYGINIKTKRADAFTKLGKVFLKDRSMSVGWIQNAVYHSQESYLAGKNYSGLQTTYYTNLLFYYNPGLSRHSIDAGFSYKYEMLDQSLDAVSYDRTESVPGLFLQYTYNDTARLTFIAGLRTDFHNLFGTLVTPRVHLRYEITDHLTWRASAGKGFRAGNILAENSHLIPSRYNFSIAGDGKIENANNYGTSLTAKIPLGGKEIRVMADYYHTRFINQIVTDLDSDPGTVSFYNLNGKSYSNVLQFEVSGSPAEGLDLLAAWRINDVKTTYGGILLSKPLMSRYKGLFTASYLTHLRKWQFDYTLQLNGPGRIPSTASNPADYRREESFDPYTVMNLQVTRNFKKVQVYLGSENLLGFTQHMPIIAADDPFGQYFDSSLIWGPIHGRKIYAGFRFSINRETEE
jgi:outer membrane receptor for ferrienterochelin and colicin